MYPEDNGGRGGAVMRPVKPAVARDTHMELSGLVGVQFSHIQHVLSVQSGQDTLLHTERPGGE